ncbi:unnamed protein product, partial [Cylicostephanus goldi]
MRSTDTELASIGSLPTHRAECCHRAGFLEEALPSECDP